MQIQPPPTADTSAADPPLTRAEFEALAARIQRTAKRAKSLQCVALFMLPTMYLTLMWRHSWIIRNFSTPMLFVAGITCMFIILAIDSILRKDSEAAQRLLEFIRNTQDRRQLGSLLDLQGTNWHSSEWMAQIRIAAKETVPRLLPLLQSDDADTLNTAQRARLRRTMFSHGLTALTSDCSDTAPCLLLLSVLEKIGDAQDLPDIERLGRKLYITDEVHAAAERCAEAIKERVARENLKDVLLRPDRNPDAPAMLLRPSIERADTPPQQLLRAAASEQVEPPA